MNYPNQSVNYLEGNPVRMVSLLTDNATSANSPKMINGSEREQIMLCDPLTGAPYDPSTWGGSSGVLLGAWNPATNTPPLASGTAPAAGQPTNYIVTTAGITTLGSPLDGIVAARFNDIVSWTPALGVWTRLAGPRIAPIAVSSALTLTDAHAGLKLVCTGTPSIKLPTGLAGGFGVAIRGAFTLDVTGLTIGSGVTDFRTVTGLANMTCVIDCTGTDTYDLLGSKT